MYAQQMTALQRMASSKNAFEISFSSAKVRLLPSRGGRFSTCIDERYCRHTNHEREVLLFATRATLTLDGVQAFGNECFRFVCGLLVHDDLQQGELSDL